MFGFMYRLQLSKSLKTSSLSSGFVLALILKDPSLSLLNYVFPLVNAYFTKLTEKPRMLKKIFIIDQAQVLGFQFMTFDM